MSERTLEIRRRTITVEFAAPRGAPGPTGPPGAVDDYVFTQGTPAATWTINHNLGRKPLVSLLTVGGMEMNADILHVSVNQVQVNFAQATAGSARLI